MAEAGCSKLSNIIIRTNLRMFGGVRELPIPGGRPRILTLVMLEALCEHLIGNPELYLDEIGQFLLASSYYKDHR